MMSLRLFVCLLPPLHSESVWIGDFGLKTVFLKHWRLVIFRFLNFRFVWIFYVLFWARWIFTLCHPLDSERHGMETSFMMMMMNFSILAFGRLLFLYALSSSTCPDVARLVGWARPFLQKEDLYFM